MSIEVLTQNVINLSTKVGALTQVAQTTAEDVKHLRRDHKDMRAQLDHQNGLLADHIKGVNTQADLLAEEKRRRKAYEDLVDAKLELLNRGPKFRRQLYDFSKHVLAVSATAAGLIYSGLEILQFLSK